jgi:hypothetical protein
VKRDCREVANFGNTDCGHEHGISAVLRLPCPCLFKAATNLLVLAYRARAKRLQPDVLAATGSSDFRRLWHRMQPQTIVSGFRLG